MGTALTPRQEASWRVSNNDPPQQLARNCSSGENGFH
jgi:hypothetical protein